MVATLFISGSVKKGWDGTGLGGTEIKRELREGVKDGTSEVVGHTVGREDPIHEDDGPWHPGSNAGGLEDPGFCNGWDLAQHEGDCECEYE